MGNNRRITEQDIIDIVTELADNDVDYVVFGGVALNAHGVDRVTQDLDLFIRNEKENVNNFFNAFNRLDIFEKITEDEIEELKQDGKLRYAVIFLTGEIGMDLTVKMGDYQIDNLEKESISYEGVPMEVVTLEQLYHMKKNSSRRKDQEDVLRIMKLRKES